MRVLDEAVAAIGAPLSLVELRDLDGQAVAMGRWRHSDVHYETSEADALRVALNVGGSSEIHHVEAGHSLRIANVPGYVGVFPEGRSYSTDVEGNVDVVKFYIDVGSLGHPDRGWPDLPPLAVADEAVRAAVVTAFVAARAGDGPRSRRAATGVRRAARGLLMRQARSMSRPQKGGLPPTRRRRVERLIGERLDAHYGGFPSVGELAAEARLSVNHFIRAFRQVTGATPHQYGMAQRQQRAMALLGEPSLLVADVADLLGFSSPAHFTASFRQKLGVTPGDYRDAVLSPSSPVSTAL